MSTNSPAPAEAAAVRRCLLIHDLVMPCRIGVHEHERHGTQRVRINVRAQVADDEGPIEDSIANVVSYETIVDGIRAIVAGGHINLVETLADRIVELCLANRRVLGVWVRVEKLDLYPDADGVGVEVERNR